MKSDPDKVWFKQMQQEDGGGLRSLFDKYYTILCRYIHTMLGDETVSEDVVQSIFVYIWEHRHNIIISGSVKAYLFTASRNKALNYLRDERKFTKLSSNEQNAVYEDMSVEVEELHRLLEEAVQALPEKCQQIFRLSREEELSYKEIAKRKGISVKTVEAQIHLAIKRLRVMLTTQYTNFILFMLKLLRR